MKILAFVLTLMALFAHPTRAADAYTLKLYKNYCQSCHSTQSTGAPQSFDVQEWQKRIDKKGRQALLNNAISGLGNMPPQGSCAECSYEDFEDLLSLMSSSQTPPQAQTPGKRKAQ